MDIDKDTLFVFDWCDSCGIQKHVTLTKDTVLVCEECLEEQNEPPEE